MKRGITCVLFVGLLAAVLGGAAGTGCEELDGGRIPVGPGEAGHHGIVGGEATGYQSWQGAIAVVGDSSLCSGTLIDPRVVLTAGHCVWYRNDFNYVNSPWQVSINGGADLYQGSPIHHSDAQEIVVHPDWPGDYYGGGEVDLAMILLEDEVTAVESYPLRVSPQATPGTPGVIVGYGLSQPYNDNSAGTHRAGDTTVLDVEYMIIELGDPTGTCSGDSGGPLFTEQEGEWALSGVASYVDSYDCEPDYGSYNVNTVSYRQWIEDQVIEWTGHGLPVPGGDADGDSDTDADTDADSDADTDADGGPGDPLGGDNNGADGEEIPYVTPADSGCGCDLAGSKQGRPPLLARILGLLL